MAPTGERGTPGRVIRAMVSAFDTGDTSEVDRFVHEDYFDHQGLGGEPMLGVAGFIAVVEAARTNYSTLHVTIEDLLEESDRVAARLQWVGTRTTGAASSRESLEIVRVQDGRAIEHWGGRS